MRLHNLSALFDYVPTGFLTILLAFWVGQARSQVANPNVADGLEEVVCLSDSVSLSIKADYTAEAVFKQKYLFRQTFQQDHATLKIPISSYIEFTPIAISTMLPDGRRINLEAKDIETISDFSPQFYPDSRTKIIRLPSLRPNSIASVSYKLSYSSLLYLPQFLRQRDMATYNSYLEVHPSIPLQYYATEGAFELVISDSLLVFRADTIPAFRIEDHMEAIQDYRIVIRPDSTVYEGEKYGFGSWADVAAFYNSLSSIRAIPDSQLAVFARQQCANAATRLDSLEALYDFVRENIRYISLDLGRGDFTPLAASEVLKKRFGDCKDQSALLTVLCRAMGFSADLALIATRDKPPVITQLPWPGYFDHVMTAIDTGNGYLFLDASQATCCFGKLPVKLRNRRALVCGNMPFLDFTLTSPLDLGNYLDFDLDYEISEQGDIRCQALIKISRDPAYPFYAVRPEETMAKVAKLLFDNSNRGPRPSNFKINTLTSDYLEIGGTFISETIEGAGGEQILIDMTSPSAGYLRQYFKPGLRTNPYVFDFTFSIKESVRLRLGDRYIITPDSLEMTFSDRGLQSRLSWVSDGSTCRIERSFKLLDYSLPPDIYSRYVDFLLMTSRMPYYSIEIEPAGN